MNYPLRNRVLFLVTVACLFGLATRSAHGQSFYSVSKAQLFIQSSSAGSVADPAAGFGFRASGSSAATLTPPSGSAQTLTKLFSDDDDFSLEQSFATKAELDAAFPAGTYRMTGTGIPTLNFNLTTDLYPATNPAVTGGTWNAGGLYVVNPAQANTISFNTFAGYASTGVAGHMEVGVRGLFDNVRLGDNSGILSVANPFGLTVTTTPLTSFVIPANTLTNGRVYEFEMQFETAGTFDTTTLSGGGVVALFSKTLKFYVSAQATGTTTPAPVITAHPASVQGVLGGQAAFNIQVTVGGSLQLNNVQTLWYFNGKEINLDGTKYTFSTNSNGIIVKNLTAADVGNYSVTVINAGGIVSSNAAALTLGAAPVVTAPAVTRQPASVTVTQGTTATFGIEASGSAPLTYRWQRNGTDVQATGSSGPTISLPFATATNAGTYTCIVTNSAGTATSGQATLSIATNFTDPGRLTNLSVLTDITASGPSSSFTLGTVVGGSGTSGNKPLVIRAVGPSLGALGVPGTIADPKVDLLTGQTVALTNDNWNGDAGVLTAMASVGAFALTGPTSKDAAIYAPTLVSRDYTVQVSGVGGAAGTVIAEIYDATPAGTYTTATPRLINVSVLKTINANGSITLGFTVGGSSAKAILIRAIGPGLAAVGVTSGTVADPQLTLFNSSSIAIATNNDWSSDQAVSVVGGRVNAFVVGNAGAKDAMLLVTLPPGGYTARASGVGGAGGLVIVEAYEVP